MKTKHFVTLSKEERNHLAGLTKTGSLNVRTFRRAQILLKADRGPEGPGWSDEAIAGALEVHPMTVRGVRKRYGEQGLEAVLHGRYVGHNPAIVTGDVEAHLIAWACSEPPEGRAGWTMQLLADKLVTLNLVEHISDETVRQALKKTNLSRGSSKNGAFPRKRARRS